MKSKALEVESLEIQLERYRDKIEEFGDVKVQLKDEIAAHSAHYTALLNSEQEVESLKKFKLQVETYRQELSETKISLTELSLRYQEQQDVINSLSSTNSNISNAQHDHLIQQQSYKSQLQVALERIRELECMNTINVGDGISEFNPLLMQELEKLRSDNIDLKLKLDNTSLEALDKLQQQNADVTTMNTSLQKKLLCTKDSLSDALNTISNLRKVVAKWELDFHTLQNEYNECCYMHEEHNIAELRRKQLVIQHWNNMYQDKAQCLEVVEAEAEALSTTNTELTHSLNSTLVELKETQVKAKEDDEVANETIRSLKRKYTEDINTQHNEAQAQFEVLQQTHQQELLMEAAKIASLAADIEEEKTKRRRVEREKKFHEQEAHRFKMLSNNSNSNGLSEVQLTEYNTAIKEYKRMEMELESVLLENKQLKTTSGSTRLNSKQIATDTFGNMNTVDSKQVDIADKCIIQLKQERRELISKNMEENSEKMELNQKLIASEREITALKAKVTRITLEKERLERRIAKNMDNEIENNPQTKMTL